MSNEEDQGTKVGGSLPPLVILKKKGQEVRGVYVSRHERDRSKMKFKDSSPYIYTFENEGEKFSIFGFGLLDYLMKDISEGEEVRIVYGGKETYMKGKKELSGHRVEVFVFGRAKAKRAKKSK